jgi:hypothetical protein
VVYGGRLVGGGVEGGDGERKEGKIGGKTFGEERKWLKRSIHTEFEFDFFFFLRKNLSEFTDDLGPNHLEIYIYRQFVPNR